MDENETDPSVNNNNNTEYKSESDNSCNKSYLKTKCNIDQIIEEITVINFYAKVKLC